MTITQNPLPVLARLYEAEHRGVFHHLARASAYLGADAAGLRQPLAAMVRESMDHETELADLIEELQGVLRPAQVNMELASLSFLTVEHLLPRLIEAKQASINSHRLALTQVGEGPISSVLQRHLDQHLADLEILLRAKGGAHG